jgi:hypothetical protein
MMKTLRILRRRESSVQGEMLRISPGFNLPCTSLHDSPQSPSRALFSVLPRIAPPKENAETGFEPSLEIPSQAPSPTSPALSPAFSTAPAPSSTPPDLPPAQPPASLLVGEKTEREREREREFRRKKRNWIG